MIGGERLDGRVALVTGASRGLGAAIVDGLVAAGARVVAGARSFAPGPVEGGQGAGCERIHLDVRDEANVRSVFEWIDAAHGRLDLLVNNAGVGAFGPLREVSLATWREALDTNLLGAFLCTREAFRRMADRGGRVIHIGSVADHTELAGNAAYAASKAGVRALSGVLNEEGKALGVRSTLLSPGAVSTDLWEGVAGFDRADMLSPGDVARTVVHVAATPLHVRVDEVRMYPPKKVL